MRQVLLSSAGAVVARMPRAAVGPGQVLVRVQYSLVSVGTEIAALAPAGGGDTPAPSRPQVALALLGKAARDPRKAGRRVATLVQGRVQSVVGPRLQSSAPAPAVVETLQWEPVVIGAQAGDAGSLRLTTDGVPAGYQALSAPVAVPAGHVPVLEVTGTLDRGTVVLGLLDEARQSWVGSAVLGAGDIDERLVYDPRGTGAVTAVIANNGGDAGARLELKAARLEVMPPATDGLPHSELEQQGWNVGYSVAGEVVAVGEGVTDFVPGDLVAAAGAGQANHADYVSVRRNLVCRVPEGCGPADAATTTVGAIALQGVRRASPELGERVCVLGLGLIGQITVQLLRASGAHVIGYDLDPARVDRARSLGMDDGASELDQLHRLVSAATGGHGVDRTLVTAATKSDAVINLAMDVTRAKGRVVIVGDVGLGVERAAFYRKEIDLLMSTSYGPGRYDRAYEDEGRDYPFGYVRWTMNRNMSSYLELVARGDVRPSALVDEVASVDDAPDVYARLAAPGAAKPLGVLFRYDDGRAPADEPLEATRISLRGGSRVRKVPARYALVGAGAFGQTMLVPQLEKRKDVFALTAVVSRDTTRGGNFARQQRIATFTTEVDDVLRDPEIDLLVVATRHDDHADTVVRALEAGKDVFVEKPLALSWDELERVLEAHDRHGADRTVMVGFNRRFSPAVQRLSAELRSRTAPIVATYRVNAGRIPLDHWVQGPQGGGRNLGEACHMYDVFRSLTGAPVASISATPIDPGGLPLLRNDNFSATLTYEDGSLCTLVYAAVGPKSGLGKERIEVLVDGEAYVIDDFTSLTRAGDGAVLWSGEVDKGHAEELSRLGDALVAGGDAPIPFREIAETSAVALHVEDLLHAGSA